MIDKGHCKIALEEELPHAYDIEGESDNDTEEEIVGKDAKHVKTEYTYLPQEHYVHSYSDHELRLPSGRILGHSSLSRYYCQTLHTYPIAAEHAASRSITAAEATNGNDPTQDHSGGQLAPSEMGMIMVSEFKKRALRATEKKALK